MANIKYETDKMCADAALLFRKLDAIDQERRSVAHELRRRMVQYRDTMKIYGFGMDNFRKAIEARGML